MEYSDLPRRSTPMIPSGRKSETTEMGIVL